MARRTRRTREPDPVIKVARWSAEHPWRAIAGWIAFVALCVVVGGAVGTREQSDADQGVGEWGRSERIVEHGHFQHPVTENVLVTARSGPLDQVRARAALADVGWRFASLPEVARQDAPVLAGNGRAMLLAATMARPQDPAKDHVQPLLDATAATQASYPDLRVEEVGGGSIDKALDKVFDGDFHKAEKLSVPISLAILVVAFGALIAAGVPVLLALSSVMAAIGLSALVSHLLPVTDTVSSVILLIGMAVGIDYSLFYVRRAREERAGGASTLDAVEIAAATSGRAVVVSGLTVAVAMGGLLLSGNAIFSSLGAGAVLVVAVAVLGSITVLPAVLARLGRWVDRPRVPLVHRLTMPARPRQPLRSDGALTADADAASVADRPGQARLWSALLRPTLRRPALALAVSAGLLAALAVPALGMRTRFLSDADLPRSVPVLQSYDRLTAAFPNTGASHTVAVEGPAAQAGEVRAALLDLAGRARADRLFAPDRQPDLRVSADRRVHVLELPIGYPEDSREAFGSLAELRGTLVPATVGRVSGVDAAVGGGTAASKDFSRSLATHLPLVAGFVLLLTFGLMMWAFRSVVVAATAIVLNLLSVGAAYGLLVLVFQHHWAEGLLGFRSNGAIVAWIPMFLFVVLFGLSMDYHVFVVSRIREAAMRGLPTRDAVRQGITSSAGAVTSAAVVMVAVFSIFATLSTLDFKQLGIGLGAAILLDATVVRAVLLPSVMTLLGRWNWWAPRLLRRRALPPAPQPGRPLPAGGEPAVGPVRVGAGAR